MAPHLSAALALSVLSPLSLPPAPLDADAAAADVRLLTAQGLGTDPAALLAFFRRRTPAEADRRHIGDLVRRLGSEVYAEREAASRELVLRGEPAKLALRQALADPDPEVARRAAACLAELAAGPGPDLAAAAARALARRPAPGAVPVLLAYLPFAEDDAVEGAVLDALATHAARAARPDPSLVAALHDPDPSRRGGAACALARSADPEQRAAAARLLGDADPRVRFRTAEGLLAARDRAAVPTLIDLLAAAPPDLALRAEEQLQRLAGETAPAAPTGDEPSARRARHDLWQRWWAERGAAFDPARLAEAPRWLGLTLVPEMHAGKVWECAADGKPLWQVSGLDCPIDAEVLPGGRVLVAELHGHRVSERDRRGAILWSHAVRTPIACRRLPNGHTFIVTNSRAFVVTADGREVFTYAPGPDFFIHSADRMANGHVLLLSMKGTLREVDGTGKEVRSLALPAEGGWSGVAAVPGGRYLAVNNTQGRVLELDATGKIVWEYVTPGACYATRLPNGNTLVVSNSSGLAEVDRAGKEVWTLPAASSLWRAHRR